MHSKKILILVILIVFIIAAGCNSDKEVTGKVTSTEPDIYEDKVVDNPGQELENQLNESQENSEQSETQVNETEGEYVEQQEFIENQTNETLEEIETVYVETEDEGFKFPETSIVSTQHNLSLSLDNIKHEIKSEYWGKITGIALTIFNNSTKSFKPKVLVLLYDEKDFKEEWFKPKAEIQFDIDKLNSGDHITKDAIVNIAFDDIYLTKKFELVLVDAADPANKAMVVVEKEFNPLIQ